MSSLHTYWMSTECGVRRALTPGALAHAQTEIPLLGDLLKPGSARSETMCLLPRPHKQQTATCTGEKSYWYYGSGTVDIIVNKHSNLPLIFSIICTLCLGPCLGT